MEEVKIQHQFDFPAWYMSQSDKFYLQNDGGNYTDYNKANLRLILRKRGLRNRALDDENMSQIDSYMTDLLNYLISVGCELKAIKIQNGWLELDSLSDYELYKNLNQTNSLKNLFSF